MTARPTPSRRICGDYRGLVRYVRNPSPGPLGHNNFRHLCEIARGAYFKFLFDDDILHPFCAQYLVEALEAEAPNGARLAFSPRITIDEDNRPIERFDAFAGRKGRLLPGAEIIRRMATTLMNPIGEFTTVLFRRADAFDQNGDLAIMSVDGVYFQGLVDVALFINLCARGPAVVVDDVLSYFRIHAQSNSDPGANRSGFSPWRTGSSFSILPSGADSCRRRRQRPPMRT